MSALVEEARRELENSIYSPPELYSLLSRLMGALEAAERRAEEAEIAAEIWKSFAKTLESGKPAVVPNPRSA